MLMRNNMSSKSDKLKCTNVVYQFSCPFEDCRLRGINYIGVTTTSLSRRLTMHLQDGAPKQHMTQTHQTTLTRKLLTENTTIIKSQHNKARLLISEALLIRQHAPPSINSLTPASRSDCGAELDAGGAKWRCAHMLLLLDMIVYGMKVCTCHYSRDNCVCVYFANSAVMTILYFDSWTTC